MVVHEVTGLYQKYKGCKSGYDQRPAPKIPLFTADDLDAVHGLLAADNLDIVIVLAAGHLVGTLAFAIEGIDAALDIWHEITVVTAL